MRWQGKVIGGVIGAVLTHHPVGVVAGILIGHQFDILFRRKPTGDPHVVSAAFFRTTFAVMGAIAKADGRVSETEIQAARGAMQQMRLTSEQVQAAIRFFTDGKQAGFDPDRAMRELRDLCGDRHDLLRMFVEIQMRASLQGNNLQGPSRGWIQKIGQVLGMSVLEMAHMEAVLRLQRGERPSSDGAFGGRSYGGSSAGGSSARTSSSALADAYRVLDIEPTASNEAVVKAYRRQMSRHHPDKLVANGLPESMTELANEQTQQIREAYETIRTHRGMK